MIRSFINAVSEKIPIALWVGIFCLSIYLLTNKGADTSEASFHQDVARSIVTSGKISLPEDVNGIMTVGIDGKTYASHEIGNTIYLLLSQAIQSWLIARGWLPSDETSSDNFSRLFRSLQSSLTFSGIFVFYYLILTNRLGIRHSVAVKCVFLLAFTTFCWGYSGNMFDGVLCALLWTGSFYYFLGYLADDRSSDLGICMFLIGFAIITRMSMVLALLPFSIGILRKVRKPGTSGITRDILQAGTILLPFATWQMWYNHIRTGSILTSPVQTSQYAANNSLDGDLLEGILGILISPGKGLVFFAPLLILAIIGIPQLWKTNREAGLYIIISGIMWLLLHGKIRSWYGAASWGPRYFITILPILMLPLAYSLPAWMSAGRWKRICVLILALFGFTLQTSVQITDWHYRLRFASEQGWLENDDFYWNPKRNQTLDAITSAVNNVSVMNGTGIPSIVHSATPAGIHINNRFSNWTMRLAMTKIPTWAIRVAVFLLVLISFISLYFILVRLASENFTEPELVNIR